MATAKKATAKKATAKKATAKKATAKKTTAKKATAKKTTAKKATAKKATAKKATAKKTTKGQATETSGRDSLVRRLQLRLAGREGMSDKQMFGGSCFLYRGNMLGGVMKDGSLCLRLGPVDGPAALSEPHTRPMDFTGRQMPSMIYVDPPGFAADAQLDAWLDRAMAYASNLPPK